MLPAHHGCRTTDSVETPILLSLSGSFMWLCRRTGLGLCTVSSLPFCLKLLSSDSQELEIPDVGHGAGHIPGFEGDEGAPAAAAAPDESLVAPQEECSVCLNGFERPTITPCGHWFCR